MISIKFYIIFKWNLRSNNSIELINIISMKFLNKFFNDIFFFNL